MIGRAYRFLQLLSIDIVIGVVILLRFFCAQFQVHAGWEVYVLLGGTVWLIYTLDHLRDAKQAKESVRERYVFHRKHRRVLVVVSAIVLILMIPLLLYIPHVIFLGGAGLALFSVIYLLIQDRLSNYLSKELYVAVVYSLGILMVPMLLSQTFHPNTFVLLFLLTFINLIVFSWYEKQDDETDGFQSIATQLQSVGIERLIVVLLAAGLSLALLAFNMIHVYFIIAFVVYASIFLNPNWYKHHQRYRTIGDGVFLLPILFEWL